MWKKKEGGRRTELEDPDDDHENDDDDADDGEALFTDPVLDVVQLAVGRARALVDRLVVAAVPERPHEVDADGDDHEGVDGDGVGVEADRAVLARARSEQTT